MQWVMKPKTAKCIDEYMIGERKIPGLLLMEQASVGVADAVCSIVPVGSKVLCVCGRGNNGGDGYAAGRILLTRGYNVYCASLEETQLPADAEINRAFFRAMPERYFALTQESFEAFFAQHSEASVIVDAVFGTGLSRVPEGLFAQVIETINAAAAKVVAVDIPSGVFGATGACETAIDADVTVAFQYLKPGHLIYPGAAHCGEVRIQKIGIDDGAILPDAFYIDRAKLPERPKNAHKGMFGKLGIVAGSKGMAGAAALCARSALAMGAGLTRVFSCEQVCRALQTAVPEVMTEAHGEEFLDADCAMAIEELLEWASAVVAGPGLSLRGDLREVMESILKAPVPKLLDADALNQLTADALTGAQRLVITPHPGEFSRLTGKSVREILSDPMAAAQTFSEQHGICVLLKGASTVICSGGKTAIVTAGSPGMAKGGSGDVLSGAIGALLAQGMEPFEAASTAAWFCGRAGQRAAEEGGEYAVLPSDTVRYLGRAGK